MHWYGSMWPMTLMMIGWLLPVVIGVGVLVWLAAGRNRSDAADAARRILAERYARGELDAEEYTSRLATLR